MNKIFSQARGAYGNDLIDYAEKVFGLIKKVELPVFGEFNGRGDHPYMLDPTYTKDTPKYDSIDEWLSTAAIYFTASLASLNYLYDEPHVDGKYPLPTQKTVNDWFVLGLLNDGSVHNYLSGYSLMVSFLYNQDDEVFNKLKTDMRDGKLREENLLLFAEYLETGEFYDPQMLTHPNLGERLDFSLNFNTMKHPFWKDVKNKIQQYEKDPSLLADTLPKGTKINPDTLPTPKNYSDSGLNPTVDNGPPSDGSDLSDMQFDKLIELYIGFFGRAAEHSGLEHHKATLNNLLNSGLTEDQAFVEIANGFWEAGKDYSHMTGFTEQTSDFDFIAKVYENVLGRPDAVQNDREGIEFWTQEMQNSGASHGEMVLKVLEGAHNYMNENPHDHVTAYVGSLLDNRTDISLFFSQESISGDLFGNQAIQTGWDVINRIDQNASSVNNVKNALVNNTLLDLPELDLVGTGSLMMMDEGMMI